MERLKRMRNETGAATVTPDCDTGCISVHCTIPLLCILKFFPIVRFNPRKKNRKLAESSLPTAKPAKCLP
jgi:hypothetical protein